MLLTYILKQDIESKFNFLDNSGAWFEISFSEIRKYIENTLDLSQKNLDFRSGSATYGRGTLDKLLI